MWPSFIKSFLWGSEEQYSPETEKEQYITEQKDDWLLVSEQGTV